MRIPMTAAPSGLATTPGAFATEFAHAMIAARLITPLVPTNGTDFAAPDKRSLSVTMPYIAPETRKMFSMLWAGKDKGKLPPLKRPLPMLFRMPGVLESHEDREARLEMRSHQSAQPKSVIHHVQGRENEEWVPSFYSQLEFMDKLVSMTVDKLGNGGDLSRDVKEAAQIPNTIVDKSEIRSLQQCCFDYIYYGPFLKMAFKLVSAAILATSQNSEDLSAAADKLSKAAMQLKAMDFTILSAIALETSWNLYVSAGERHPVLSDHSELLASAKTYFDALKALKDQNQDPLGYSVMLTRGLTISMDSALKSMVSDNPHRAFFKLAHEFSTLSYMWHVAKEDYREAAADATRMVWLAGQLEMLDYWQTSQLLIDGIASLLGKSHESKQNIVAILRWAEEARRIKKGEA